MKFVLNTAITLNRKSRKQDWRRRRVRFPALFLICCLVLGLSLAAPADPRTVDLKAAWAVQPGSGRIDPMAAIPAESCGLAAASTLDVAAGGIQSLIATEIPDTEPVTAKAGQPAFYIALWRTAHPRLAFHDRQAPPSLYVFYNSLLL